MFCTYHTGPAILSANYPTQEEKGKGRIFLLGLKRGESGAETFPHHLMSESSDAVIDSLNQSRNEERNHNSNLHFKQEI